MPDDPIDIQFFDTPLDPAAAIRAVTCPEAGGINVFVGTTRGETHAESGPLDHLDYHAYHEMALSEMRRIAGRAQVQWPIIRAAIWHRLGPVAVGQASVVIAVSSPHRGDAFAACQFVIDELKKSVPIWKKEVYGRQSRWQGQP